MNEYLHIIFTFKIIILLRPPITSCSCIRSTLAEILVTWRPSRLDHVITAHLLSDVVWERSTCRRACEWRDSTRLREEKRQIYGGPELPRWNSNIWYNITTMCHRSLYSEKMTTFYLFLIPPRQFRAGTEGTGRRSTHRHHLRPPRPFSGSFIPERGRRRALDGDHHGQDHLKPGWRSEVRK